MTKEHSQLKYRNSAVYRQLTIRANISKLNIASDGWFMRARSHIQTDRETHSQSQSQSDAL
jgi:hypothetical protein